MTGAKKAANRISGPTCSLSLLPKPGRRAFGSWRTARVLTRAVVAVADLSPANGTARRLPPKSARPGHR